MWDCSKLKKFLSILNNKGLVPLMIKSQFIIYNIMEAEDNWNNIKSYKFKINNEVGQGGVIYSLLFAFYTDMVINKLIIYNTSCKIENISTCIICWWYSLRTNEN